MPSGGPRRAKREDDARLLSASQVLAVIGWLEQTGSARRAHRETGVNRKACDRIAAELETGRVRMRMSDGKAGAAEVAGTGLGRRITIISSTGERRQVSALELCVAIAKKTAKLIALERME